MGHEVVMPKTGLYVDEVRLEEWLVADGSHVEADQVIMLIVTDKVDSEIPADATGWLQQEAAPGRDYPIGTRLGVIHATEEEYRQAGNAG